MEAYDEPANAHEGSRFLQANTSMKGGSVAQNLSLVPAERHRYTFSVWLRSPESVPFGVCIAIWFLRTTNPRSFATCPTVGSSWQEYKVEAEESGQAAYSSMRVEVYMENTNRNLDLDSASLIIGEPPGRPLAAVSNEAGESNVFWKGANGDLWEESHQLGAWHEPSDLGMGPLGSAPTAALRSNGEIVVFGLEPMRLSGRPPTTAHGMAPSRLGWVHLPLNLPPLLRGREKATEWRCSGRGPTPPCGRGITLNQVDGMDPHRSAWGLSGQHRPRWHRRVSRTSSGPAPKAICGRGIGQEPGMGPSTSAWGHSGRHPQRRSSFQLRTRGGLEGNRRQSLARLLRRQLARA
jgi:hypothetical protein